MNRTATLLTSVLIATSVLLCAFPALADEIVPLEQEAVRPYRYYPEHEHGMLHWELADGFDVHLGARLQIWAAAYTGDDTLLTNGDLVEREGFRLRRSRIYFGGHFTEDVSYMLSAEFFDQEKSGGPLLDAYIDYTPTPLIGATLGVTYFPFSAAQLLSSEVQAHLARARVSEALSPGRTMGLVLHSEPFGPYLTLYAGVFNGLKRAREQYFGYEGVGVSLGNRFEGASYVGRVEVTPFGRMGRSLADVTVSATPRLGFGGAFFFNDGNTIETMGWSAYVHFKWMGFHFLGEYLGDDSEPAKEPTTDSVLYGQQKRNGAFGELGYMILPELLGLAVRVEWFDPDVDIDDQNDEIFVTATATLYGVRDLLKFQVEYTHREELHGPSLDNDSVLMGAQLSF